MKEIFYPHDSFFYSVFSQKDNVRDLVLSALPDRIIRLLDLEDIEVSRESFVDRKLISLQSDILIKTRLRKSPVLIYILVEHKSHPYRWTVFQLLKYMVRIWEKEITLNSKQKKLPPIIPLIFYHGRRKWKFPLDFSSYFTRQDEFKSYIPDFKPLMLNLQHLDDKEIRGGIFYQAALKAFKYGAGNLGLHFGEILRSLLDLPDNEERKAFISVLFGYIISVGSETTEKDIYEDLRSKDLREVREVYMTIAERLRERGMVEGKRRGKLEGIHEGKLEGEILDKQHVLLRLLEKKFGSIDETEKEKVMNTRDRDRLDRAIDRLLDANSIEEVLQPFN